MAQSSMKLLVLLAALLLVFVGIWALGPKDDLPVVGDTSKVPLTVFLAPAVSTEMPQPPVLTREAIATSPLRVRVVDKSDSPVQGATISIGGMDGQHETGMDGRANLGARSRATIHVHKIGYQARALEVTNDEEVLIVMDWNLSVAVRISDQDGNPIEGVQVWIPAKWMSLSQLQNLDLPTAKTAADGMALVDGLSPGTGYVHAYHPNLVLDQRRSQDHLAIELPAEAETALVMSPLYVFAYRATDIQILNALQTCSGGFAVNGSPVARETMKQAKHGIERRFPGSVAFVTWKFSGAPKAECEMLVCPVGRYPFRLPATPVRLDEFKQPVELSAAQSPPSNDFGSCIITVAGVDDAAFAKVQCLLTRDTKEDLDPHLYEGFSLCAELGALSTLPSGRYTLRVPDVAILDSMASKKGRVVVKRGEVAEVTLEPERPLYPVAFALRTQDGSPVRDFQFGYSCPATGLRISEVVSKPEDTMTRWLPEGVFNFRIFMAGPSAETYFLGTGSFTVVAPKTSVDVLLVPHRG